MDSLKTKKLGEQKSIGSDKFEPVETSSVNDTTGWTSNQPSLQAMANDSDLNIANNIRKRDT